jgi:outer membrane lipoprotein-sorting protein
VKIVNLLLLLITVLVSAALLIPGCSCGPTASSNAPVTSASKPAASQPAAAAPSQAPAVASSSSAPSSKPASDASLIDLFKKKDSISSVSYDAVITGLASGTQKVYLKKTKMRIESSVMGIQSIIFMDLEKRTAVSYSPSTNMATKMDFNQFASSAPDNSDSIMKNNPKIVGIETLDGKLCTVIQYTNDQGTTKQWLWQEKGFPVRIEMTTPVGRVQVDMKNFDFSDIADSMFNLPAGVTVSDPGQLTIPTGIPGIPTGIPGIPTGIPGIPTNLPNIPGK